MQASTQGDRWYRNATWKWQTRRRASKLADATPKVRGRACSWARFAADEHQGRSLAARVKYQRWLDEHLLRDRPDWQWAVHEAQRAYPDTEWWLLSCSASEGGHGRWVPNRDGAPPGGWLQFYESTFWRMWASAYADVTARGFVVPRSAHSWYSPLGQALAGAWGLTNGRRGEWAGAGC